VTAGNNITYTFTVTNQGPAPAPNARFTDSLPANATFVSESQTSGPAFTVTNPAAGGTGAITGTITSLAAGGSATFTVVVHVPASTPSGTNTTDTVTVRSDNADLTPADDSAT